MAKTEPPKPNAGTKPPGAGGTIVALLLLAIVGGGGGGFLGYTLATPPAPAPPGAATSASAGSTAEQASEGADSKSHGGDPHGGAHDDSHGKGNGRKNGGGDSGPGALQVRELPSIVTNLGQPETSWIRLQTAIVYDPKEIEHAEKLVAELMSDITAFLRNVSVSSLEGADGLRRLQEDLSERAAIRSGGKVREFIIETMVVQ